MTQIGLDKASQELNQSKITAMEVVPQVALCQSDTPTSSSALLGLLGCRQAPGLC